MSAQAVPDVGSAQVDTWQGLLARLPQASVRSVRPVPGRRDSSAPRGRATGTTAPRLIRSTPGRNREGRSRRAPTPKITKTRKCLE